MLLVVNLKKEKVMKNVILVSLVAFGLVACGAKEEAAVEAAPAAEVAAPAEEAAPADAAVVEAPAAEVVDAAPVAQ